MDGLRAWAVALVVLYHLRVPGLPGGFVGVDVFFVISGFVVTRVLSPRVRAGSFSLRAFYVNRFWRLQPAFLLMSAVTLVASFFLLAPADLLSAARSALAASTLSANFFFWLTTDGYGTTLADQQPLLHTWSLAVEEQFYLVWPWLVLLFARRRLLPAGVWIAVLLGLLGLSEWLARTQPSAAYYLLPARLFELGLGAALVATEKFRLSPVVARITASLGAVCVVGAGFLLNEGMPFPGLAAALPCLGTALLIQAGTTPTFVSRLFETRVAQALGRQSYSLYLWHWPPIAFANYLGLEFTPLLQWEMGLGALVVSALSLRFWENPTRRAPRRVFRALTLVLALSLAAGVGVVMRPDSPGRVEEAERLEFEAGEVNEHLDCLFAAKTLVEVDACGGVKPRRATDKRLLVWGDSHARIYGKALNESTTSIGWTPTVISVSGCPPLFGIHREDEGQLAHSCNAALGRKVERFIQAHSFDAVLIVGRFGLYEKGWIRHGRLSKTTHFISDGMTRGVDARRSSEVLRRNLEKTVRALAENPRRRVLFALPTPSFDESPKKSRKRELFIARDAYLQDRRFIDEIAKGFRGVATVIDPTSSFCDERRCGSGKVSERLYDDETHLSKAGRRRLVPLVEKALRKKRR